MSQSTANQLTDAQKSRMERNRVKAMNLRQAKLVSHPYSKQDASLSKACTTGAGETTVIKVQGTKFIDSGGGFLVEQPVISAVAAAARNVDGINSNNPETSANTIDDAMAIPISFEECLECGDSFADSFLFDNFGYSVCDKCKDSDERHSLITRTEAKAEYLLKDCDFDKREPALRYISRKNPHNVRWGEMKLYLHLQVEQRAMEVWGTEEMLMRQHENRDDKREITKVRKYNKQMKQLRMEVRSSLYTKETKATHQHEFGADSYNEDEDTYTHKCLTCAYEETYEKM